MDLRELQRKAQEAAQAGQQAVSENVDMPLQAKLQALQAASAAAAASTAPHVGGGPPAEKAPALTLDGAMAQRQKLLDMYKPEPQEAVIDPSQYKQFKPQQAAPPAFQGLKQKLAPQAQPNVRDSLPGGLVEVTPELEEKLGYGK